MFWPGNKTTYITMTTKPCICSHKEDSLQSRLSMTRVVFVETSYSITTIVDWGLL